MIFDLIAFDADDTLWHTENFYRDAEKSLLDLLEPYGLARETALDTFHQVEIANLADFGYGIKGFVISMIQASVEMTGGRLRAGDVLTIVELGRSMVRHEVSLLPGVEEAVKSLAESRRLALITKGDLMDQERKIRISGLARYFELVEIVSDKTPETYAGVVKKWGVSPERFLMVGNSLRSDILPVIDLGGWAVYVPYEHTWAHESQGEQPVLSSRYYEIPNMRDLGGLLDRLEQEVRS